MAIAVPATRQILADAYKSIGSWVGLATADPGTSSTPANEVTGGGYARVQTTWTSATGGVVNGSAVTISCPAATMVYAFLASGSNTNSMFDRCAITSTTLSSPGTIIVTPSVAIA